MAFKMDSPFKVKKTKEGANLKRWFKEKWVDTRTGKPCGRSEGENRGTPYCRPSKRISSKTTKTAGEMTDNAGDNFSANTTLPPTLFSTNKSIRFFNTFYNCFTI